ncbi:hypothetical protein [Undibacterium sp. Xuan67W]|uniref:hypothetical protein n=1 Tax=Undibacterium sp. Xuan67W TaxID=3413057 RepID=UPI003BEFCFBA
MSYLPSRFFSLCRLLAGGMLCLMLASPASALYDPKPDANLSAAQGEWSGSLTYRDYSSPDKMVALPTRMFISLSGPDEISLHFIFADGPAKTVYSYEKIGIYSLKKELTWSSGVSEKSSSTYQILADDVTDKGRKLLFEKRSDKGISRYTLEIGANVFVLSKDEIDAAGVAMFRNRYLLSRPGVPTK